LLHLENAIAYLASPTNKKGGGCIIAAKVCPVQKNKWYTLIQKSAKDKRGYKMTKGRGLNSRGASIYMWIYDYWK
jgi:hypothetical protein